MSAPDPELIKEALLAELGRSRQDELPLSSHAKRPTYQPARSGTSHIPQARKERLESKWDVKIVDEESQQMEGLELGNSRPWARLTNQFMARHVVESAPPRLAMGTSQTRSFAIPRPPSSIKPARAISNGPARTLPPDPIQRPPPRQVTQVNASMRVTSSSKALPSLSNKVQGGTTNSLGKSSGQGEPKPSPSTPQQIQEHILSQGICELFNESDNSSCAVKFMLKVQLQKNKGLLLMKLPDKEQSVYDVLWLGAPVIQGPFCLISSAERERLYKLKFQTSAAAEGFQYLLKSLQQSALQFREANLVSPKATPMPTTHKATTDTLQTPSKAVFQVVEAAPKLGNDNEKHSTQTPDSIEPTLQQGTEESLVDVQDDSPPNPTLTIEAAADHMQGLVHQILSEITAAGIKVPEKGVDEIESTAIANWVAQGFMNSETESDELKEELVELLRLLVRIKRKVQFRHGSIPASSVPISSATLQDLQEIVEKPSKRIKYTTTDIKELEVHAVSRQNKIKASGLQEIQKGWSATSARPVADKKPAAIPPKAPTTAPKSQKPIQKGLSSSRWADKPVENEGKYAGF
ncbi:hypothetical protein ACHAQJ_002070 [Trichoderma viride]